MPMKLANRLNRHSLQVRMSQKQIKLLNVVSSQQIQTRSQKGIIVP